MSTLGQSIAVSAAGVPAAGFSGWPRKKSPTPKKDDDGVFPDVVVDREPSRSVEQAANGASSNSRHAASDDRLTAGRRSLVAAVCIVLSIKARSAKARSPTRPQVGRAQTPWHRSTDKWRNIVCVTPPHRL
jgi:hypothetical protein